MNTHSFTNRPGRQSLALLGSLVLLAAMTAAAQAAGGIQDGGGFFSAEAKARALPVIQDIERRFQKSLVIETFKELPPAVKAGLDLGDKMAVGMAVDKWAVSQAKGQHVNGVYVLLLKEPARLQVEVGNTTQQRAFTLADRDSLARLMLGQLRQKQPDQALTQGVNFVLTTMAAHGTRPSSPAPAVPAASHGTPYSAGMGSAAQHGNESGGWMKWIILGVLVWVGLRIVRGLFGGRGSGYNGGGGYPAPGPGGPGGYQGYGGGYGGGGGGFFSNMVGGLFGAAAGSWMYDQFSGRHHTPGDGYGGTYTPPGDGGSSFDGGSGFGGGQDTDYSGSGGDFGGGDSGGGGDFGGGGDSGGGDF